MSDQIPFHIQEDIMKRLPVKSLVQIRCVSKAWKSLIDSSEFIAAHSLHRHTQPQHLLVADEDAGDKKKYVSFVEDDTFPQQRSVLTLPLSIKQLLYPRVLGSSHGLLCLYCSDRNSKTKMAVLWNPSIRKLIVVVVPRRSCVGFGVCPVTIDPKIVAIRQSSDGPYIKTSYRCKVMVYTLSSGNWRSLSTNLPTERLRDTVCSVVTDRFIYWRSRTHAHNMIMSFDVTNESFELICLPDSLACFDRGDLCISKLSESLAILEYRENISTVWMMEDGFERLFTKLWTIKTPHDFIAGFTKNGILIVQVTDTNSDDEDEAKLVVYEPNSEHNNVIEISPPFESFYVNAYMETLLLLG